jgi:hypothetical protein
MRRSERDAANGEFAEPGDSKAGQAPDPLDDGPRGENKRDGATFIRTRTNRREMEPMATPFDCRWPRGAHS